MTVERIRRLGVALAAAVLALAVGVPAQQAVTETRDPAQQQDDDFAKAVKEWTTQPFYTSPLVDHLPRVAGVPMPKDVLGYHVGAPAKLTYYADILKVLPRARRRQSAGQSGDDRQVGRRSRARRDLDRQRREHEIVAEEPREPGEDCRSAWTDAGTDQTADRDDEAALPPDGGTAQRRDGSVRDAHGARVPSGHRDVSADQADSRERHRIDHAGRRSRRSRSQRRLVLQDAGDGAGRGAPRVRGVRRVRGCGGCDGCAGCDEC